MAADRTELSAAHRPTIERVVQLMRAHLHEPLALEDLAAEAHMSPFHFSRVFRQVTGAPPGEFLGALRLDAAKRLLLSTPLSVTDVCFEVGYTSLGSFTTRFTRHVGLPPAMLRRLVAEFEPGRVPLLAAPPPTSAPAAGTDLIGRVEGPAGWRGLICVGLFTRPTPQGAPAACTTLTAPGPYCIRQAPPGVYHLLCAALPLSDDPLAYLVPSRGLLVGTSAIPILVTGSGWRGPTNLVLRPPGPTDPPIVGSLPLLQARWLDVAE